MLAEEAPDSGLLLSSRNRVWSGEAELLSQLSLSRLLIQGLPHPPEGAAQRVGRTLEGKGLVTPNT